MCIRDRRIDDEGDRYSDDIRVLTCPTTDKSHMEELNGGLLSGMKINSAVLFFIVKRVVLQLKQRNILYL